MTNPTYGELRQKVENDLDLQEETFISPTELMGYCNEAIREAAAEIHDLYEDYFLSAFPMTLVNNQAKYDLPPDLYAFKIREIVYAVGTKIYAIRRLKSSKKFEERATILLYGTADYYRYMITNIASEGPKIELTPTSKEDSVGNAVIWYIRDVAEVTQDSDFVDIPEFKNFIMAFMKYKCWSKEMAGSPPDTVVAELEHERKLMIDTLTYMVADDDTEVEKDMSIYEDMV